MKGEVVIGFVGNVGGRKVRPTPGEVIEVPANVDWVQAGFVRLLEEETPKKSTKKATKTVAVENDGEIPTGE